MKPPRSGDPFEWRHTPPGRALVCRPLEQFATHVFTTRDWALGGAGSDKNVGWTEVAAALGVDPTRLVRVHQVHGASVVVRRAPETAGEAGAHLPDADIIVSNDPSSAVAIQTADCVALLMADRRTGGVAAAHAGWRGLAAGVPAVTVEAMVRELGSRREDLVVAIGPSIGARRYEVGVAVRSRFEQVGYSPALLDRWFFTAERPEHWYFDGWRAACDQLEGAGVLADWIHVAALCTASNPDAFCSYRRDGLSAGRMAAAISPRPDAIIGGAGRAQ